ncbi:MAG: DUF1344 domain-containing protein [Phyllobacterium sp.]|uniref:DUF1344 domain-containing protein n=1 Tax=Phyllobacterium sp. TaxID=1871046 RepID=UPI0030F09D66
MKIYPIAALALLALSAAPAAYAKNTNGTITAIDIKADTVTLDNGSTLHLPESIEVETLKVGEHVQVSYSTGASGTETVKSIRAIK